MSTTVVHVLSTSELYLLWAGGLVLFACLAVIMVVAYRMATRR